MQSIRNTHIDLKGGWFHWSGPYPLRFDLNASSASGERSQVTISSIDIIGTLAQHSSVYCMPGKNNLICKAGRLANL